MSKRHTPEEAALFRVVPEVSPLDHAKGFAQTDLLSDD
jgi:hypothetical protein